MNKEDIKFFKIVNPDKNASLEKWAIIVCACDAQEAETMAIENGYSFRENDMLKISEIDFEEVCLMSRYRKINIIQ